MASLADMKLPDISSANFSGQDAKQIKSYLYQLNEQLRYLLGNIGEDQLSSDVKDQLDLTKLLIDALGGGTTINISSGGQSQPWSPSDTEQIKQVIQQIGDRLGTGSTNSGSGGGIGDGDILTLGNVKFVDTLPANPQLGVLYIIAETTLSVEG